MPGRVVIFDTSCLLCSKFIQVLLKNDNARLHYAGFESEFARQYLPEDLLDTPETVVFYNEGAISTKSRAVLAILQNTTWTYRWLRVFGILPKGFLDYLYDWVARNRYSWFGRSDHCFIPSSQVEQRFLA